MADDTETPHASTGTSSGRRVIPFGQYGSPTHVVAHLSDTHLLAGGAPLYAAVPTEVRLQQMLDRLERIAHTVDAVVVTGDLADLGEPDAYRRLRSRVEPVVARLGAELIWVMGNHDVRGAYARELFDEPETDAPRDRVHEVRGLRIVSLDSTVPGAAHGELEDSQLTWLADVLATPAEHGTFIAMHHPPLPTVIEVMGTLELERADRLAEVIAGTDVRGVLAGHLHYATHSTLAGIPVSVAAASCYVLDPAAGDTAFQGVDGAQSFDIVHVYPDRVVHATAPIGDHPPVSGMPALPVAELERLSALATLDRRRQYWFGPDPD